MRGRRHPGDAYPLDQSAGQSLGQVCDYTQKKKRSAPAKAQLRMRCSRDETSDRSRSG